MQMMKAALRKTRGILKKRNTKGFLLACLLALAGCATLRPLPPAVVMLPAEKFIPESQFLTLTALEMGTKSVYPFVPIYEPRKYGLFLRFMNVSEEQVALRVLVSPPLSALETCNLTVSIAPGKQGGVVCMQSHPAADETYSFKIIARGKGGRALETQTYTARFSKKDVSAFIRVVEGDG